MKLTRHAEILIKELEVHDKEAVATPRVKRRVAEVELNTDLSDEQTSAFRALAARANYMSMDRPDISFASKECCRRMSKSGELDWRVLRGLHGT